MVPPITYSLIGQTELNVPWKKIIEYCHLSLTIPTDYGKIEGIK